MRFIDTNGLACSISRDPQEERKAEIAQAILDLLDSAFIEAARALGCHELLSEDLGDGQDCAGVLVTNPFQ